MSTKPDASLKRKLNLAIKALEFYADPLTYFAIGIFPDPPCGDFMRDFSKCENEHGEWVKPGKRARKALQKILS